MNTIRAIAHFVSRPDFRGWLYRVLVAAGAVAAGYGLISGEELALWTGLVAVVFVVPAVHTPVSANARRARGRGDYAELLTEQAASRRRKFEERGR